MLTEYGCSIWLYKIGATLKDRQYEIDRLLKTYDEADYKLYGMAQRGGQF